MDPVTSGSAQMTSQVSQRDDKLMAAARELEASFLTEMLKSAGMGKTRGIWWGGGGGAVFLLLVREQARAMVSGGGIGLAQSLFEALKERENGTF